MLVVNHTCGHQQGTNLDRLVEQVVAKGIKTKEEGERFIKDQIAWLEGHVCPQCYRKARGFE